MVRFRCFLFGNAFIIISNMMQPSLTNIAPNNLNNVTAVNIESIIERLLAVKGSKPLKNANITEQQIRGLITSAQAIFMNQPMLLALKAPVKICGDIHGQYGDLLRVFDLCGYPPMSNYLFLGDYVDRGKQGIETICLLLAFKLKYPENFFLLRGNHESEQITKVYGFFDECKRRYSVQLWKMFTELFKFLPVAAIIDDKILCMHGGLSPELTSLDDINKIPRPAIVPPKGLLCDILWSDPKPNVNGWGENDRGISFTFGENLVQFIIQKFKLELICRAHQVVEDGYEFFAKRRLVTVFTAPNYMGEFDNSGGIMIVNEELMCSFRVLKPAEIEATAITASGRRGSPAPRN